MEYLSRKLQRLREYDYSTPGAYFVTICTYEKRCVFGKVVPTDEIGEAIIKYSQTGEIAIHCLLEVEKHFPDCKVDHWVVMPNHIHILLSIGADPERIYPFPTANVSHIIGTYKAAVSRACRKANIPYDKLWQASFYDHIIRNEEDYLHIWQYISGNPSKWMEDRFYVE